jgi:SpoIID/LytB domain protein
VLVKQVLLSLAVAATAVLGAAPSRAAAPVPVLVVDGKGFGHGVGMAQDGAYWMARAGASLAQIVGHFYPGVAIGRGTGVVRVAVLTAGDRDTVVTFPAGGEVRSPRTGAQAPGFPVVVPAGGSVRIRHDSRYRVTPVGTVRASSAVQAQLLPLPVPGTEDEPATTTTTAPLPDPSPPGRVPTTTTTTSTTTTTTTTPSTSGERTSERAVWAVPAVHGTVGVPDRGARYRGEVEAVATGGALRLIDEVDVEDYLRGMGEVRDPTWPLAALEAQAVAARTYALRAMQASGEICDTQRCQVYLGAQAEYPAMDRAVAATSAQVLTYGGRFAAAVYSANGGGVSATPQEGFGTANSAYPYLTAATYTTRSPDPWQVKIALSDLAGRLRYRGDLRAVEVASVGPSGRPTSVALDGSAGTQTVPAMTVARALGLRSTLWGVRVQLGDAPIPPPAEVAIQDVTIQALPDHLNAAGLPGTLRYATPRDYDHPRGGLPILPFALGGGAVVLLAGFAAVAWYRRTHW